MSKYICSCCDRLLDQDETKTVWDDVYDEIYVNCRYCGGECFEADDEEMSDDFWEEEDEFEDDSGEDIENDES